MEVGTLENLCLQPGDVVECVYGLIFGGEWTVGKRYTMTDNGLPCDRNGPQVSSVSTFRIISRANPKPKLWRDMTPEEKGALLLAAHEGTVIEVWSPIAGQWRVSAYKVGAFEYDAYRIKPQPKIETHRHVVFAHGEKRNTTYDTVDGKVDWASFVVEDL